MDNKTKLRILSKIGIILVFMAFFTPVFSSEAFSGLTPLSVSLYIIFLGSCVGFCLFIGILSNTGFVSKYYNIKFDWINIICITLPFPYLIYTQMKEQNGSIFGSVFQLQPGVYVIFIGLLISIISLVFATLVKNNKNVSETNIETDNSDEAVKNEKILLDKLYKENKKLFVLNNISGCGIFVFMATFVILNFFIDHNSSSATFYIVWGVSFIFFITSVIICLKLNKKIEKLKKERGIKQEPIKKVNKTMSTKETLIICGIAILLGMAWIIYTNYNGKSKNAEEEVIAEGIIVIHNDSNETLSGSLSIIRDAFYQLVDDENKERISFSVQPKSAENVSVKKYGTYFISYYFEGKNASYMSSITVTNNEPQHKYLDIAEVSEENTIKITIPNDN